MRVRKLLSLITIFVAVFVLFNIISFIGGPTQNSLIAHASTPGHDCSRFWNSASDYRACIDEWAKNTLGMTKTCPEGDSGVGGTDLFSNGECMTGEWNDECVFRCYSLGGGETSAEDCAGGDYCLAFEDYYSQFWVTTAESNYRSQCDNCLDNCWYAAFMSAGTISEGQCQQEGIHNDGQGACRTYIPAHGDRPCATDEWIGAWTQTSRVPIVDVRGTINRLCEIGSSRHQGCDLNACKQSTQIADATTYLQNCGATADNVNDSYQKEIQQFMNKLELGSWLPGNDTLSGLVNNMKCVNKDKSFCGDGDVKTFARDVMSIASIVFGGLAMLKIIFGGVLYATAAGNPGQISTAKEHIKYALIGITLILGMNIFLALLGASPY
ncbi:MAG: pilin [bacterium]|nr:pilin [bacterium]